MKDMLLGGVMYLWAFQAHWLIDAVVRRGPELEKFVYLLLAAVPQLLVRSKVWRGDSILAHLAQSTGSRGWRHILLAARNPAARAVESFLMYLSVNLLARALPINFAIEAPEHLSFLDPNSDGILTALEIETVTSGLSLRILVAVESTLLGWFLMEAKRPPDRMDDPAHVPALLQPLEGFWRRLKERKGVYVILNMILNFGIVGFVAGQWLHFFGFRPQTVMTFGGIGGIAFGLAAQNLVGNFISGILILVTQPFKVGEWIASGDVRGTVRAVRWNNTEVETKEGPLVIVPNSTLVGARTQNRTQGRRRLYSIRLPIRFPPGEFPNVDALIDGLTGHLAQETYSCDLFIGPKVFFIGVDTTNYTVLPIPKIEIEVAFQNKQLGNADGIDLISQVNVAAVKYLLDQGFEIPGLESRAKPRALP